VVNGGASTQGYGLVKVPKGQYFIIHMAPHQPYMFTKEVKSDCHSSQQLWLTASYINNIPEYSLKQSDYN